MFSTNKELLNPIQYIKGVGPKMSMLLAKKEINTIIDALYFLPRTYEDRRQITKIFNLQVGEKAVFIGKVLYTDELATRITQKRIFTVTVTDHSSQITLKWFMAPSYLKKRFKEGMKLLITGVVSVYNGKLEVHHPNIEELSEEEGKSDADLLKELCGIIPIYSETEGLTQNFIRKTIKRIIDEKLSLIDDFVPINILKEYSMLPIKDAIRGLHLPSTSDDIDRLNTFSSRSHLRLIFNEFLLLELIMARKRLKDKKRMGIPFQFEGSLKEKLTSKLKFSLTNAQIRSITEIEEDLKSEKPMVRLIQGDVGSGKTLVALLSSCNVIESGYQVALMVPTEILANQHFQTALKLFEGLDVKVQLLTGSQKVSEKKKILKGIESGEFNLLIGTHALIQEDVKFKKLGLAIIDEQHRFGVRQRSILTEKSKENIDLIIMTATPIPRTLALTAYGDLDFSIIDEMPLGRIPIKTKIFYERTREELYKLIKSHVERREQVYIVYPLVEESEKIDLKDATNMAEILKNDVFPQFKLALIHGRMKDEEKDTVMLKFKNHELDILISTTVIEVGIDVPNATLMVIEHAERFGLSQLHQLRGRVGRGEKESFCALMTNFKKSEVADKRLEVMVETSDGFKIAEADLEIRGPGEFLGTRQAGLPGFRIANIVRDSKVLVFAKKVAEHLISIDPELTLPENDKLHEVVKNEESKVFWN